MRGGVMLWSLFVLILALVGVHGAVINVACCSFSELAQNISRAASGDTVKIASGVFTASKTFPLPLNVTNKALTISGTSGTVVALNYRASFLVIGAGGVLNLTSVTLRDGRDGVLNLTTSSSTLFANDVTFYNHTAVGTNSAVAMVINGGAANLKNCRFTSNSVSTTGTNYSPLIDVSSASVVSIVDSSFTSNSFAYGAATLDIASLANVTITNTTFTANSGNCDLLTSVGLLNISRSLFLENTGHRGIFADFYTPSSGLIISGSTFTRNLYSFEPLIECFAPLQISDSWFHNNSMSAYYSQPAVIYAASAVFNIIRTTFSSNTGGASGTGNGGAARLAGRPGSIMRDCTFINNVAGAGTTGYGGAMAVECYMWLQTSSFINNTAAHGGAIALTGGKLTVDGCTFSSNTARPGGRGGGAIYVNSPYYFPSSIMLRNSTFAFNKAATNGGALVAAGPTSIANCSFTSNAAISGGVATIDANATLCVTGSWFVMNSAASKGGVFIGGNNATTVFQSVFLSNTASSSGGVFANITSLVVSNSTFEGNDAPYAGILTGGNVTLTTCTFRNHSSVPNYKIVFGNGAAYDYSSVVNCVFEDNMYIISTDANDGLSLVNGTTFDGNRFPLMSTTIPTVITDSEFLNGDGTNNARAIVVTQCATASSCAGALTIRRSTFTGNVAGGDMFIGLLDSAMSGLVENTTFYDNRIGGYALSAEGSLTVSGVTFANNIGSSALLFPCVSLLVNRSSFINLTSSDINAVIRTSQADVHIWDSHFANITTRQGTAIFIPPAASLEVHRTTFEGIIGVGSYYGGGSAIVAQGRVSIDECTFFNNTIASGSGGAIYSKGWVSISASTFTLNSATSSGGAVASLGALMVVNSNFTVNLAKANGGAMYVKSLNITTIRGSAFSDNTANIAGGIFICNANANITESWVLSNSAKNGNGGGMMITDSNVTIADSVLDDNHSDYFGGALIIVESFYKLTGSTTISGNSAHILGDSIYCTGSQGTIAATTHISTTAVGPVALECNDCTGCRPDCVALATNASAHIDVGCTAGYLGYACQVTCADNFNATSSSLTCGVGGWLAPGQSACQPCPAGTLGPNCGNTIAPPPSPPSSGPPPSPPPALVTPPPSPSSVSSATATTASTDAGQITSPPPSDGSSSSSTPVIIAVVAVVVVIPVFLLAVLLVRRDRARKRQGYDGDSTARVSTGTRQRVEKLIKNAPVLGKGLTAVVYKATLEDGTPVAVKVATGKTETAKVEFHREAHFLGLLMGRTTKHIVSMKLYSDDPRAIVMELADGGSVKGLLKEGRPKDALDIVRQVGEGLQTLHDYNIAHLDMKPENILIGSDGLYKITDFGCAVACGPGAEGVPTGTFLGTPQYCSPERFLIGVVDPKAADIYSFALTVWSIYEATGPLVGETYDTLKAKCTSDETFPLQELTMSPDTPPDIVRLVVLGIKREIPLRATIGQLRAILDGMGDNMSTLVAGASLTTFTADSGRISLLQCDTTMSSTSNISDVTSHATSQQETVRV